MYELVLKQGQEVFYKQKRYLIHSPLSIDSVLLIGVDSSTPIPAKIAALELSAENVPPLEPRSDISGCVANISINLIFLDHIYPRQVYAESA